MKKFIYLIVGLWLITTLSFAISQDITLRTGREVLLKTVPVDPRDLILGDYVILNYEIAQIPAKENYKDNETLYVTITTDRDNIAHVSAITRNKPQAGLFMKGKTGRCSSVFFTNARCINFGIESYYVKEKTGRELEKNLQEGALVKVAVDKNGKAKVKGFHR